MKREILQGSNSWSLPTIGLSPTSRQHMICEGVSKYQCAGVRLLCRCGCLSDGDAVMLYHITLQVYNNKVKYENITSIDVYIISLLNVSISLSSNEMIC